MLFRPSRMATHPRRAILVAIVHALSARVANGIHTTFLKVPAHTLSPGNEFADWAAAQACQPDVPAIPVVVPDVAPTYWISLCPPDPTHPRQPLRNLDSALRDLVLPIYRLGQANVESIYYQSYQSVAALSHPSSHHFLTSDKVDWQTRRLALKYRGGGIYNAKLALRYKRSTHALCPLCRSPDSQGHLLGSCSHPDMHKAYIARHHAGVCAILSELLRGSKATSAIQADAGVTSRVPELHSPLPVRVPAYIARPPHAGLPPLPRPDITIEASRRRTTQPHPVTFIDVKYGQDTRLAAKIAPATLHYQRLVTAVQRPFRPDVWILTLGVGGHIPHDLPASFIQLGLSSHRAHTLCCKLNRLAVQWLRTIVSLRRRLENPPD